MNRKVPKWVFGYIQSQERYETAEELIQTTKEYRSREIGLDCIVLDWLSWGDNLWGQKTFDEKRDNYREFKEARLLLPASNVYNAFFVRTGNQWF